MEEQVTASNQPGAYYIDPNGQRFENPVEFSAATETQPQPSVPPPTPSMPNFEAMRQMAMQQAIQQIKTQQRVAPSTPSTPSQSSYMPAQPVTQQQNQFPSTQVQTTKQRLTRAELLVVFVMACIAVTSVQAVWNFTSNILPRIEIRSN